MARMSSAPPPLPYHGLIGSGLIGVDPYSPRSWSGISEYFFRESDRQGVLDGASGAEVPLWRRLHLLALAWHPDKAVWRMRHYLDPRYRRLLTQTLAAKVQHVAPGRALLQCGALFDGPEIACGTRQTFSYHDGNLAMRLRSPFGAGGLPPGLQRRALAYERQLYGKLTRIFTMSEYLRQSFITDFDVPPERVVSLGAGVNLRTLPAAPEAKNYANGEVLFIGSDFERKGGHGLLRAFAVVRQTVPSAKLHIVGPRSGPPEGLPMDGVQWHGFLRKETSADEQRLDELLRRASLFVLPSLYEPFGIAPAEAMMHGMPAIVSGDWALAETVLPDKTGLHVKPGDEAALAQAMLRLLTSCEETQRMGHAAREHALAKFTWQAVVERLQAAFQL